MKSMYLNKKKIEDLLGAIARGSNKEIDSDLVLAIAKEVDLFIGETFYAPEPNPERESK